MSPEGRSARRVVVTGVGAVSPGGIGSAALWDLAVRPTDAPVDARIPGWDPSDWFDRREARRADPYMQYAVAAAEEAFESAGRPSTNPERTAVVLGNIFGPSRAYEQQVLTLAQEGPTAIGPTLSITSSTGSAAGLVARRQDAQGVVQVVAGACASGAHAIADAARLIAIGEADFAFAGATEGPVSPAIHAAYTNLRALSPTGWLRPFDRRRDGFVFGQGAAVLVLEERSDAVDRGATILAELAGWANTNDAHDPVRPSGVGAVAAMRKALAMAGVPASEVAHVNAHGTGTVLNDQVEAAAVAEVLGVGVPVTSVKRAIGHGMGAAGALEAAVVIGCFQHHLLPPSGIDVLVDEAIGEQIDVVVGGPRRWEPGPVLSNSFGIGGMNGTLLLLPPGWR